jgi:hypothetical protein
VFKTLLLISGIMILAACGPMPSAQLSPLPTPASIPSGATEAIPTATPSKAQAMPQPGEPVITLIRSGGLAGKMIQWDIYPDGRIVASTGQEITVPAAEVTQVLSDIVKLGFYELADPGGKTGKCADCFVYELRAQTDGKDRTLTFTPQASGTPTQLLQILEKLNGLLQALPKQ